MENFNKKGFINIRKAIEYLNIITNLDLNPSDRTHYTIAHEILSHIKYSNFKHTWKTSKNKVTTTYNAEPFKHALYSRSNSKQRDDF